MVQKSLEKVTFKRHKTRKCLPKIKSFYVIKKLVLCFKTSVSVAFIIQLFNICHALSASEINQGRYLFIQIPHTL